MKWIRRLGLILGILLVLAIAGLLIFLHQMEKLASGEIIIDRCPGCSGIWLDADELEAIKKAAGDEALGAGMVLGMVIN